MFNAPFYYTPNNLICVCQCTYFSSHLNCKNSEWKTNFKLKIDVCCRCCFIIINSSFSLFFTFLKIINYIILIEQVANKTCFDKIFPPFWFVCNQALLQSYMTYLFFVDVVVFLCLRLTILYPYGILFIFDHIFRLQFHEAYQFDRIAKEIQTSYRNSYVLSRILERFIRYASYPNDVCDEWNKCY